MEPRITRTTILPITTAREFMEFIAPDEEEQIVDEYQDYKNQAIKELNAR